MKLTIQHGGQTVGLLILKHLGSGEYEINWLQVDPPYRGRRLASKLVEQAKAIVREQGNALVGFIEPTNGLNNEQMKAFLTRHGFKHCWYQFDHRDKQKRGMIWRAAQ